ncbi:hypothetical protein F7725_004689, partial [Dissostichus mawsoni]
MSQKRISDFLNGPKAKQQKNTIDSESLQVETDNCHSSNPEERTPAALINDVAPRSAANNNSVALGEEPFQPKEVTFPARRVCSVLSLSSLENVPLGPCVHPVAVVISWMGPRLVDSHHLRMVSSEHSTGSLMSLSLLGSRCLKMVVLSWRSQALITARMMVCQKMYMYQR